MNRILLARMVAIGGALLSGLTLFVGGLLHPGYSHIRNFISELGATGMPYGEWVSLGGFLPLGILIATFIVAAAPLARVDGTSRIGFYLFLGSQAVAYTSAAFAPCDLGCPVEGSSTQDVHNLFGLVTYMVAAVGLFMLSRARSLGTVGKYLIVLAGLIWLSAFFMMVDPTFAPWRGLLQRLAEVVFGSVVLFMALRMLNPDTSVKGTFAPAA